MDLLVLDLLVFDLLVLELQVLDLNIVVLLALDLLTLYRSVFALAILAMAKLFPRSVLTFLLSVSTEPTSLPEATEEKVLDIIEASYPNPITLEVSNQPHSDISTQLSNLDN